jgi:hypothetical protein
MMPSAHQIAGLARKHLFDPLSVEKVLRLKEILDEIRRHPFLSGKLALKGGTAINLFALNLARLSVDIDLNYVGAIEREPMIAERPAVEQSIQEVSVALGYTVQKGPESHALTEFHLGFIDHAGGRDRLQIEINFLMRACALPPVILPAAQLGDERRCEFSVLAMEELWAGKLKALIERSHPRDLYDVHRFANSGLKHDEGLLRKLTVLFASTLDRDLREYNVGRYDGLDQSSLDRLLYPLLRADDRPSAERLMDSVRPLLAAILDHQREQPYLEAMGNGIYQPELIFPNHPRVVERIARHPALLWKARHVAEYRSRKS